MCVKYFMASSETMAQTLSHPGVKNFTSCNMKCIRHMPSNNMAKTIEQSIGPRREKTCLRGFYNIGADQPALMSAFVIRFLESIICRHA